LLTVRRDPTGPPACVLAGADVVLVGLFSAKDKEFGAKLDLLAASVKAHGGRVVSRHVQRRGVSHGGAAKMTESFSRRTLISPGKACEIAHACRGACAQVDVAVFVNPLSENQRSVLGDMFGCLVISGEDLSAPGR
jgi:50S ribosomal subunit-associated GTPase HflX